MLLKWRFRPAVFAADAANPEIALAPWAGHRQFLYDYVRNIRPGSFLELGVYHGCAFFTCCQAAWDEGLDWMRLTAVDNWLGNDNDGYYGEDVYETFLTVARTCYSGLAIHPVRKPFAEAVSEVAPASIELLHIDGCHTYDAVAADYAAYLPKLAEEGVVLLHDVFTERHGSTRFWRELSAGHPTLLFEHCFGLGLVFPKGDRLYHHLLQLGLPQLAPWYARIGHLEMALAAARRDAIPSPQPIETPDAPQDETQVAKATEQAARSREQAANWWQTAMECQWRIDCLDSPPCSKS